MSGRCWDFAGFSSHARIVCLGGFFLVCVCFVFVLFCFFFIMAAGVMRGVGGGLVFAVFWVYIIELSLKACGR